AVNPYREAPEPGLACPRCAVPLDERAVGDSSVAECSTCLGVFVRKDVLPRLLDAVDLGLEAATMFPRGQLAALHPGPMYIQCPACRALRTRRLFATGAKIIVDACRDHGVWFDAAELRAAIDFASGGGMARAAAEDARREREADRLRHFPPLVPE